MKTEDFLTRVSAAEKNGTGWKALCPAHPDQQPSLSISTGDDGKILLKCFAGCPAEEIVSALDLTLADLFPQNGRGGGRG